MAQWNGHCEFLAPLVGFPLSIDFDDPGGMGLAVVSIPMGVIPFRALSESFFSDLEAASARSPSSVTWAIPSLNSSSAGICATNRMDSSFTVGA